MSDPTIELLLRRAASGSTPPHGDGARLALCVEGGAMRGVVSAGMVVALEQLGLLRCFDAVYGSSAGAMNAAYFMAGQAALGTTIYYEDINNHHFIDMTRPLRGRSILDLDFLVDDVMVRRKPLDTARIIGSRIPLVAIATDTVNGARTTFRGFGSGDDLLHALRAGATMPVFAGRPYEYRGGRYFDALLAESIPVPVAETEGATHILALLTRPPRRELRSLTLFERFVVIRQLRAISPTLAERFVRRPHDYAALVACILDGYGPGRQAQVSVVAPSGQTVGRMERKWDVLVSGAAAGFDAVKRAVEKADARITATMAGFRPVRRKN